MTPQRGTAVARGLRDRLVLTGRAFRLAVPAAIIGAALFAIAVASACVIVVWVGVPLTVLAVAGIRRLGDTYRPWCAQLLGVPMPRTYRSVPEDRDIGWLDRLRGCLTDPATYRDVLWLLVNATVGLTLAILPAAFLLSTVSYLLYPLSYAVIPGFGHPWGVRSVGQAFWLWPAAVVTFALFWTTTRPLLEAHARLARWLLAPAGREQLIARIAELTESRADTVDSQAAELRRIERDLHDGAQARLVALGMSLGMAEEVLATDPDAVGDLLIEAREATGVALSELRALVRGIHPPVLADRGLEGAVRAVAMVLPVPVEVTVDLAGRPPEPVESAVYFAVAESLTNMAKHSGATSASLRLTHEGGWLRAVVGDDGRGGAVLEPGGGLDGVRRRLAAFDGKIDVHSPTGGPTTITLELPCELS